MKGLYKGKYLIAVYDKNDYLLEVACSPSELTCFKGAAEYLCKIANGQAISSRIFLIDVTEKHNDIFAEEDKIFLEYINKTRKKTIEEKARELNMSARTYYRRKLLYKGLER